MRKIKALLAASTVALGLVGSASAATIQIVNGSAGTIPTGSAVNDVLPALGVAPGLFGFFGSSIELDGEANLLIEYFGKEAGFRNSFVLGSQSIFTEGNAASGTALASFTGSSAGGLINFSFGVDNYTGTPLGVTNGSANSAVGDAPNFFATIVGSPEATSGNAVWLFLDDGGAGPDSDYDDMVIRITASAVPLPAGVWLLGTAVAGLAARRIARKRG